MSQETKKIRVTTAVIRDMKKKGEKITMLTAYDYPTAFLIDQSGIDALLVGDSLGMVVLGYTSTLPVTMDEMIHHTKAVCRGVQRAMVIGDMPFMSYHVSVEAALHNAGRFLKETDAQAVKLEGGRDVAEVTRRITAAGIPVMGHLGLTPQSIQQFGGFKIQGKGDEAARRIIEDAQILEEAGAFSVVLECVPGDLAAEITRLLSIPTIGIGAGVADRLVEMGRAVIAVNSSEKAAEPDRFHNVRSEMWWNAGEMYATGDVSGMESATDD
ncbi:MAG: 3-methyl-2-oxobutanoate hydroxymethyltransferase, partial [Pseudomonadota bacterium]